MGHIVIWVALIECLGILALPITVRLFRGFPDAGWSLAKPAALLFLAYVSWILASLHLLRVSYGAVLALIVLAAGFAAVWFRDRQQLLSIPTRHARDLIGSEAVFLIAFIAFAWIRSYNPAIDGQEKYMDFALLNTMLRSTTLPPPDPWLSDFSVNYYYYGYFLWSLPVRISRIPPELGYNLVLVTIAASTCQGAYGIGASLGGRRLIGVASSLFVGILGNLDGAIQVREGAHLLDGLDYWRSSRVVQNTINEFPFFSFIHGDLHPHVMALPFVVGVIALALALWPARESGEERVSSWLIWPAAAVALGSLFCMNAWDLPAYAGLFFVAAFYAEWRGSSPGTLPSSFARASAKTVLILFAAYLLFLPFHLNYHAPDYGQGGLLGWVHAQTPLSKLLIIYGLFLFPLFSDIVMEFQAAYRSSPRARDLLAVGALIVFVLLMLLRLPEAPWLSSQVFGNGTTAISLCLLLLMGMIVVRRRFTDVPFHWILGAGGLMLILACEIVYLRDPYGDQMHRMNTVFKFYYQAWVLLAIASAVATGRVARFLWNRAKPSPPRTVSCAIWFGAWIALVFGAGMYTIGATITRAGHFTGIPSLNGTAYLQRSHPDDFAAIEWLNSNVVDSPIILEATGDPYSYFARVSSNTGLPSLLGWANHEDVWRAGTAGLGEMLRRRKEEIDAIYSTANVFEALGRLERYRVRYVFVGELERSRYSGEGLGKFGGPLQEVYRGGGTAIYRVPLAGPEER